MKIFKKKGYIMLIKVFGPGCAKCAEAENNVRAAVKESGRDIEVEKVADLEMMLNGIMSTPAVMIDGKMMCKGRAPSKAEVVEWIESEAKYNE